MRSYHPGVRTRKAWGGLLLRGPDRGQSDGRRDQSHGRRNEHPDALIRTDLTVAEASHGRCSGRSRRAGGSS